MQIFIYLQSIDFRPTEYESFVTGPFVSESKPRFRLVEIWARLTCSFPPYLTDPSLWFLNRRKRLLWWSMTRASDDNFILDMIILGRAIYICF